ncbi:MAG: hypothetical protein WDO68_30245 [Gammaproteobacteria bacterium]
MTDVPSAYGLWRRSREKLIADMGSAGFELARESAELCRLAEGAFAAHALGGVQRRILVAFTSTDRSNLLPRGQP